MDPYVRIDIENKKKASRLGFVGQVSLEKDYRLGFLMVFVLERSISDTGSDRPKCISIYTYTQTHTRQRSAHTCTHTTRILVNSVCKNKV